MNHNFSISGPASSVDLTPFGSAATTDPAAPPMPDQSSAIITVVRDPHHWLGKKFDVKPDGTVGKTSFVNLAFGIAVMHHVPTHGDLAALLAEVGNDPSAAIINARFKDIEVGEEFAILSEREIEKRLGIPASDRPRQTGVHKIEHDGKTFKGVGRFKDNVQPSNWQLLDRDIDEHTPAAFAGLELSAWMTALEPILPGISKTTYTQAPSASARVMLNGKPVGGGNGHVWIYVNNPTDIERVRSAMIVLAAKAGMAWKKPRFSKREEGVVVGHSLTTIVDPSVWTPGRLVFDGKPTVGDGLTVEPLAAMVIEAESDTFDTSAVVLPDAMSIREITRNAGVEMSVKVGSNGLRITANDLTLDTEIETKNDGILTVREMVERGLSKKVRCQTPFRASDSWAAFFSVNPDGIPFIFDNGTNITHWLSHFEQDDVKLIPAKALVKELLPKVKADSAAALEPEAINALATIKQHKPADFQRARVALKQANKDVSLAAVDRIVKAHVSEMSTAQTHHGYANCTLAELTDDAWPPLGHQGALHVVNPATGLWERKPVEALIRMIAARHDGKEHCARSSDYRAIAEHAISLASDDTFFADAPNGVACPGGFYQIADNEITLVPLTPDHRQRVMLDFTPANMPTPMFNDFLHQTFKSDHAGEEQQQIRLVQEIAGGIMLGILYKHQTAILFYEPYGRAGKGTIEKQFRALVPREFVSAISPFKWHQDYHVATLAGKRLNVVGELPENDPIPAADFKSVIGGDLITGRHPTHRPITFTNEATHLFMSNHMITTKDQSEAFFARWKIVEFPNSRLRLGLPLDKDLAQRIIDNELPGIAYWALTGAARLLKSGEFSASTAHDRLMAKWRRNTNTLEEFIHECCAISAGGTYKRSELYRDYVSWCSDNGRKPFSKGRVKELLEHNVGMGIRLVEIDGYETFRGLGAKPAKATVPMATLPTGVHATPEAIF